MDNQIKIATVRYNGMLSRIRKKNGYNKSLKLSFTKEEFINWWKIQSKKCIYCGITDKELKTLNNDKMLMGNNGRYKNLSIDRKDNTSYDLNKIVLCCMRCNSIKSDIFTFEEMLEIGEKYIKPKRKQL